LDIKELPHVVNYELPNVPEDYVHRIGRTARAGGTGAAVSLVSPDENGLLKDVERLLRKQIPISQVPEFKILAPAPRSNEAQRVADEQRSPDQRGGPRRGGGGRGGQSRHGGGGRQGGHGGRGGGHGRPGGDSSRGSAHGNHAGGGGQGQHAGQG